MASLVLSQISFAISSFLLEKSSHPLSAKIYDISFSISVNSYSEISLVVPASSATMAIL
jgi:hypothetical protein